MGIGGISGIYSYEGALMGELRLVTLEGFNEDLMSLNGRFNSLMMQSGIKGLGDDPDWSQLRKESTERLAELYSKGTPHYSALSNWDNVQAMLWLRTPYVLTDDNGNTVIFGYNADGSDEYTGNTSPYREIYKAGILYQGKKKDLVEAQKKSFQTNAGAGNLETGAQYALYDMSGNWLGLMREREAAGKSTIPYIYEITKDTPVDVWESLGIVALIAAGAVASFVTAGIASPLVAAAVTGLLNVSLGYIETGTLTLDDVAQSAVSLAPNLLGDSDVIKQASKLVNIDLSDTGDIAKIANTAYKAISDNDAGALAELYNIASSSKTAGLSQLIKSADSVGIANLLSRPLPEVEKTVLSMQNSEMIKDLTLNYDRIAEQSFIDGNALDKAAIRQYLVNAAAQFAGSDSTKGILTGIPNNLSAVKIITDNNYTDVNSYKALLETVTGYNKFGVDDIEPLLSGSMTELAKEYAGTGRELILPSNIPGSLQEIVKAKIERAVPNALVSTSEERFLHEKFWKEFP